MAGGNLDQTATGVAASSHFIELYLRCFHPLCLPFLDVPVSVLLVGLGGGGLPQFLRDFVPGVTVEVVELDPVVMQVAKECFGFRPDDRLTVTLGDGLERICALEKEG